MDTTKTSTTQHRRTSKTRRPKMPSKNFRSTSRLTQTPGTPPVNPKAAPSSAASEKKEPASAKPSKQKGTNEPGGTEIDRVLDGIQAYYKSAKDLKADFHQTYTYVQMGRKQKKQGRVYFKTPHRMRWDYKKPVPQVFISDGKTLWVYQPRDAQVFKQNLNSSQLPVALTFMGGQGDLRTEFKGSLKASTGSHYRVELIPRRDEGNYKAVILTVNKTDFSVVASTVVDPVGNLNELKFSKVQRNTGVPDRAFEFKVPKGVRIIDPPR